MKRNACKQLGALRFVLFIGAMVPMVKQKIDGVIEAVHYTSEGQVAWVRAYERRGPTFSDRVLLDRSSLISRLRSGERFFIGSRKPLWASTFEIKKPLRLVQKGGQEWIVAGERSGDQDALEGAPLL